MSYLFSFCYSGIKFENYFHMCIIYFSLTMDEHMQVFSNKQFKCNWWMHGHSSNWWKLDLFTTCKTGVVTRLLNLSREPVRNDCGAVQCGEADWCWCGGLHCSHGWPGAWKSNSSCAGVFCPTIYVMCPVPPLANMLIWLWVFKVEIS